MTSPRRSRLALVAVAVAAAALLLSGCAPQQAGSAATLGDSRISEQALTTEVEAILVAKGQPTTSKDQSLVTQTLGRMITMELVDRLAVREGVEITQGDIDEVLANYAGQVGGEQAVEDLFIQENVAPSQLESLIRLQLQAQELGIVLNPSGSAEEQGGAVFEAAGALSLELDTTVSPRYGTWDPSALALGPTPDDLSTPPALS
jgi:peptidyl-prolyl cis-trans isomerase SurA